MPSPFELRTLPLDQLVPAPYNPRRDLKATDKAYRKLRRSVERFGLVEPLVWNEPTGRVVGGHLRLRILKELNYAEVPVSVVRLTEAEERALNVVLNNQEAQGRYYPAKLGELLADLRDLPEFDATGFDGGVFRLLDLAPAEDAAAEFDDPDRVSVTLVTTAAGYDRLAPALDELLRAHDLEAHVQRG